MTDPPPPSPTKKRHLRTPWKMPSAQANNANDRRDPSAVYTRESEERPEWKSQRKEETSQDHSGKPHLPLHNETTEQ
ncbi:hypothetical protein EJ03DRAFT_61436 [Teratosphaeria nubilosa]|uniref:Uncharacterized protein n=1 Tax=Teratosphaeria nubilosa TaxID=161662 RepID=A0A6G1LDM3_9PEZI|nr:hypothetical protein EJ03DRAFT_61436 [Teratosphaeria nubilosa]